jgi:hypothetical protein
MNMKIVFRIALVAIFSGFLAGCSSDDSSLPLEPVVTAYDTVEYRYQQVADLAIDLMANISMDPSIKVKQVQDLLDREPVVSLDFRNVEATQRDISRFINYQHDIELGLGTIFSQLGQSSKWREAPLILEIKNKYSLLNDSILMAAELFNTAAKNASLQLAIPVDSARLR